MGVWPVSACTRVLHTLLGPGHEAIVELGEAGDALGFGLEQEALTDEATCYRSRCADGVIERSVARRGQSRPAISAPGAPTWGGTTPGWCSRQR